MHDGRLLAVLCGIDEYRGVADDLQGCVNDIDDVEQMLLDVFDADPESITTLRNAEATRAAIIAALSTTIAAARPGDHVYIHLAGHGSSIPDRSGDEADGLDEIFLTADHDWHRPLSDDDIRTALAAAPTGVAITFIADSCHSGSITRSDGTTVTRFAPWPRETFAEGRARRRRPRPAAPAADDDGVSVVDIPEVVFTACRPDQTAAEVSRRGVRRGAFTHAFVTAVRRSGGTISHRALHTQITGELRRDGIEQHPQLEGAAAALDRLFLDRELTEQ